jgi:predicted dehydrogenase
MGNPEVPKMPVKSGFYETAFTVEGIFEVSRATAVTLCPRLVSSFRALTQYEVRAVSTSRRESAHAAGTAFAVTAYDNAEDLIRDPGVDLVVVAVRVTCHHTIAAEALRDRKIVFVEWLLGVTSAEAIDLNARAVSAGIRTAVGLQARFSAEVRYAQRLITEGYIGRVLSTSLVVRLAHGVAERISKIYRRYQTS